MMHASMDDAHPDAGMTDSNGNSEFPAPRGRYVYAVNNLSATSQGATCQNR
jgi:hypothetical protein